MKNFETVISFHPTFKTLGDQPTLKDMVFDYYCKTLHDDAKANEATKKYLDEVYQVAK